MSDAQSRAIRCSPVAGCARASQSAYVAIPEWKVAPNYFYFYSRKGMPILTLGLYRLSCVAQNPPSQALRVAHLLLELAYDNRFEGLTYGGTTVSDFDCAMSFGIDEDLRPSDDLEGYADATWTSGLAKPEELALPPELTASQPSSSAGVTLADLTRRDASGRELFARVW